MRGEYWSCSSAQLSTSREPGAYFIDVVTEMGDTLIGEMNKGSSRPRVIVSGDMSADYLRCTFERLGRGHLQRPQRQPPGNDLGLQLVRP